MSEFVVARRYAKAFFELALEAKKVAEYEKEVKKLVDLFQESPSALHIFEEQQVSKSQKHALARSFAEHLNLSQEILGFLFLLVERQRLSLIEPIYLEYKRLHDRLENIANAEVTVADERFSDEACQSVLTTLSALLGKTPKCTVNVDKNIWGGFILKVGDSVFDSSLKGRLQRMKETFLHHQ